MEHKHNNKKKNYANKSIESIDDDIVTNALSSLGKSSIILLVASTFGMIFQFIVRIIIARFYNPNDYGLFNLFYTILNIFLVISMLGLSSGLSRFIAFYNSSGEEKKTKEVEKFGIILTILSSICFGIFLFFFSPELSNIFTDNLILENYLKIAAITLPSYGLLSTLTSIYRGHKRIKEKILFFDVGKELLFLIFCIIVGILSLPFIGIIWSFFISYNLIAIVFLIYYFKIHKSLTNHRFKLNFDRKIGEEILIFSIPILFVEMMNNLMGWTDTIMIGYFLKEASVGFYNVAKPLSLLINTSMIASAFIYVPIATDLFAKKRFNENKVIYSVLTKWICIITLPIAIVLFFYAEEVIKIIFGIEYISATIPLKILTLTYFIQIIVGPVGHTLTAFGKTKFLMYSTIFSLIINIILNIILIPKFGISGAAIATSISFLILIFIKTLKLFSVSKIHSMKKENIIPLTLTIFISSLSIYFLKNFPTQNILKIILTILITFILYLLFIIITHSLSDQDIKMIENLGNVFGIDLNTLLKFLNKYKK